MFTTLNDLSTPVHYYLRVNLGTSYKYVVYDSYNEEIQINDGEIMDAVMFSSLDDARFTRDRARRLLSIPNIYIDIIKHTVKVSVVTDEIVED